MENDVLIQITREECLAISDDDPLWRTYRSSEGFFKYKKRLLTDGELFIKYGKRQMKRSC